MKFEKGDKVTLKKSDTWAEDGGKGIDMPGPKFGEVVTVRGYMPPFKSLYWVMFEEYLLDPVDGMPMCYNDIRFEKVVSDKVLIAELEQVKEPYTI